MQRRRTGPAHPALGVDLAVGALLLEGHSVASVESRRKRHQDHHPDENEGHWRPREHTPTHTDTHRHTDTPTDRKTDKRTAGSDSCARFQRQLMAACQAAPHPEHGSCGLLTLNPQPSTLNPQPSTLNPHASTLTPQPSRLDPHASTLDPRPSTQTLSPQPSALNPIPRANAMWEIGGHRCRRPSSAGPARADQASC
eukprot:947588-Rhodomonas_salina.3